MDDGASGPPVPGGHTDEIPDLGLDQGSVPLVPFSTHTRGGPPGRLALLGAVTRLAACGRAVPFLLAALLLLTPAARADSALYLSWNDCALGSESVQTFVFDCGSEAGAEELFCAFRMPLATGADVLGMTGIVDLQRAA